MTPTPKEITHLISDYERNSERLFKTTIILVVDNFLKDVEWLVYNRKIDSDTKKQRIQIKAITVERRKSFFTQEIQNEIKDHFINYGWQSVEFNVRSVESTTESIIDVVLLGPI